MAGLGAGLEAREVAATAVDGGADRTLADVVAGADGGGVRQGIGTQRRGAFALRQDQAGRVGRQLDAVLHVLQQGVVVAVVADQYSADGLLAISRDDQTTVAGVGFVDKAVAARTCGGAVGIADGADVDAEQLELGRHVRAHKGFGIFAT